MPVRHFPVFSTPPISLLKRCMHLGAFSVDGKWGCSVSDMSTISLSTSNTITQSFPSGHIADMGATPQRITHITYTATSPVTHVSAIHSVLLLYWRRLALCHLDSAQFCHQVTGKHVCAVRPMWRSYRHRRFRLIRLKKPSERNFNDVLLNMFSKQYVIGKWRRSQSLR